MFPDRNHCDCNHFPRVMQFTDHPEISSLGLPAAVQFLTMNDWTRDFAARNFPTIRKLYAANGFPDRVDCHYYDTPHSYDKPKRERTYLWMEKWVRGNASPGPIVEPDGGKIFPPRTLEKLTAKVPANKGFAEISRIFEQQRGYTIPPIATSADWQHYRQRMLENLEVLLGLEARLPRTATKPTGTREKVEGKLVVERTSYPSEGGIMVPVVIVRPADNDKLLPAVILLGAAGKESLLAATGPGSARALAADDRLVALPDVRCFGALFSTGGTDHQLQRRAWERNGIVWGRPVPAMACTDLRAVLDGLSRRGDINREKIELITRASGDLAIAALFTASLDPRITALDVDMNGCCYDKRNLAVVPFVLQYGDVLQWAALLADRELAIRDIPEQAGDPAWLRRIFTVAGNRSGLQVDRH